MIGSLNGIIDESSFSQCTIDVNGVGYDVEIPLSTFDKLPLPGNKAKLFIHTQVREDAITLFGFATAEERELFRTLIGVSGIGGKLGCNAGAEFLRRSKCGRRESALPYQRHRQTHSRKDYCGAER